jgi:RNA polymerase sigma-70 factor (ECF subfamily)
MSATTNAEAGSDASRRWFVTTHWSVVLAARDHASAQSDLALERLCQTYWWPLYAFVRRRGYGAHDAEDLTQEFFSRLLAKDFLQSVDRSKGKFRSFLLAALEHFLAKEWRRANTQKRGGKFTFVSTDTEWADQQYLQIAGADLSPEQLYAKQWAIKLLEQVVARLREEFAEAGREDQFEHLKIFLIGEKQPYAELAAKLGTTEAALKMAVSRMRQRYKELLREEIASTVSGPAEIEEELRAIIVALS